MLRCKLCRYFFFTLILFIQLFFSVAAEQRNNKPLMVIGLEQDQYPFQFINTIGELDGVLVDFWRAWAIQQQVDVKFIVNNKSVLKDPIASDSGVNGAFFETAFIKNEVNKAADTNASVTHAQPDNVQAETILLPFSFPQVININKNLLSVNELADITPYAIGVVKNSSHIAFLQMTYPNFTLKVFDQYSALYQAALANEVVAFVDNNQSRNAFAQTNALNNLFPAYKAIEYYTLQFSAKIPPQQNNKSALKQLIQQGIADMSEVEQANILKKWLGEASQRKRLLITYSEQSAPYLQQTVKGQVEGLLIDLWRLWSEYNNVEVDFVQASNATAVDKIENNQVDAHIAFSDTALSERVEPFYLLYQGDVKFYLSVKNSNIEHIDDLANKNIAIKADAPYLAFFEQKYPEINFVSYTDLADALMPAQATKVDGLVGETQAISLLLTQASLLRQFYLLPTKAHSVGFHLLTSNQHGQLSQMITDGFSLIPNNRLIELEKQWLPIKRSYYFEKKSLKVTLSPKYQTWLNEHPVIKVGLVTNWSPMESVDKYGDYIGINPDFFRLLEDRIGVKFQYVSFDKWQNVLAAVEARTVDMIASVSVTDTRKAFLNFSDPYWNMPWGLLHPVTGGKKASLSDFENESVAAIAGIHIIDVIKQKFPNIKFVEVEKLEEGYLLLQQGNVAALVTSIAPASELLKRESLITMGLSVLDNLAVDTEQFGIRNDWPEFLEIVNQALSSVTEQEINNITDRWFNVEITTGYEKDVVIKLAIQIGIFIVIVLAVIVFWNRRLYSEIKQRKALEIKMKHMATHDDLTGLANRTLLTERIKSAINFHQRQRLSLAVLFIDLDGFKHVNDNFGHHVGDELLIQLTARLKSCVREYDTVARFGGDEFVLLITGLHDKQEAAFIAEKALKVIRRPVELSATTVSVSCSIGIAAFPDDGDTDTELLKVADTLMYRVKAHGKNHYIFN